MSQNSLPRTVAVGGGFWNTQRVQYSSETQKLMKVMMEEAKLTNFQQRSLKNKLQSGETLPTTCPAISSANSKSRKNGAPKKFATPKVLNPKNYKSSIRTRSAIEESGAYEVERYKPPPARGRSEYEKDRFANKMAYGVDIPPPNIKEIIRKKIKEQEELDEPEPEKDRFDELVNEIEERRKFLDQMENLGQGKKYRTIIQTETSQLLREMEIIDKKRSNQLEEILGKPK